MKTFLVTGSTSGLGLEIVKALVKESKNKVIMAVRNLKLGLKIADDLGSNVQAHQLDLSRLSNVQDFIKNWDTPLDGLINNAGTQFINGTQFTPDGYEETIAVNHLAAFMLTIGLKPHLSGKRVLFIGSGTHNPNHCMAKLFGFKGAQYTSIPDLLKGKSTSQDSKQMNLDRYATSKMLNMVSAIEFSRRFDEFSSYVLDPGLMPGTSLARHQNNLIQFLWKTIMPVMSCFLPDTSSAQRSGKAAAWMMTTSTPPFQSGQILSYDRKINRYVDEKTILNKGIGSQVYEESMKIINNYLI